MFLNQFISIVPLYCLLCKKYNFLFTLCVYIFREHLFVYFPRPVLIFD